MKWVFKGGGKFVEMFLDDELIEVCEVLCEVEVVFIVWWYVVNDLNVEMLGEILRDSF